MYLKDKVNANIPWRGKILSSRMFNMVITVSMSLFYISIIIPFYYSTVQMIVQYIGACLYLDASILGLMLVF